MVRSQFLSVGFYRCPVCGRRHSDDVVKVRSGRPVFTGPQEFLGWALCQADERMSSQGFVALVEVTREPEADDAIEQLEQAERTGNVYHVPAERWHALFDFPLPVLPMIFVDQKVAGEYRQAAAQLLH